MTRINYTSIPCEHCGSPSGEGCKTRTGRATRAHAERTRPLLDAWRAGVHDGQADLLRSPRWYERERQRWLDRQEATA